MFAQGLDKANKVPCHQWLKINVLANRKDTAEVSII